MVNIYLEDNTKKRLTKALGQMQASDGNLTTYSKAVAKLLDLWEKQEG